MTVELDILGPAHGGSCVARLDGRVVFVRGALPGERGVPVTLDGDSTEAASTRRFLTGEVADSAAITVPSVHRVDGVCPAAAAGAGCCDLDFVDAAGSLEYKSTVVTEQFARIGHIDLDRVERIAPEPFTGYRTRVRLGVDGTGRVGLRCRNSSAIVPLDRIDGGRCAQWAPGLADGLVDVLGAAEFTPGAEVCVALGDDGGRGVVEVPAAPHGRKRQRGRGKGRRTSRPAVQRRVIEGTGSVVRTVGAVSWTLPVEAFWQAHTGAPTRYSGWVRDTVAHRVGTSRGATAWDLYGGAGVFAAALVEALPGTPVECVDGASAATAAGKVALAGWGVDFVTGDVAATIPELSTGVGGGGPDVVVLDPPRTGAGAAVIEAVALRRPGTVLHIGCDPATAARDAAVFVANGYRPESVTVVDAFGLTHHVEVLMQFVPDAP
ncbi:MAG: class I SAM-dependent RNA methyltransferase [Mycobacteriaceae bacterium]|uniref:class I SAM-dependent RNA methyltransferase n=1 Tax=Corynebacterium sp. TaxID=1720 RepID=UPI003F953B57